MDRVTMLLEFRVKNIIYANAILVVPSWVKRIVLLEEQLVNLAQGDYISGTINSYFMFKAFLLG